MIDQGLGLGYVWLCRLPRFHHGYETGARRSYTSSPSGQRIQHNSKYKETVLEIDDTGLTSMLSGVARE